MTDPDLWAEISARPLVLPDGTPLEAALRRLSSLGSKAPDAVAEYRRWLYLSELSPGLAIFRNMQVLRAWHMKGAPDLPKAERAPVTCDAALLSLYRTEFGAIPPHRFWRSMARERGVLIAVGLGLACHIHIWLQVAGQGRPAMTPGVALALCGFVLCLGWCLFNASAHCGAKFRNPA